MTHKRTIDWKALLEGSAVRSIEDLKSSLLRRAERGESSHTLEQMKLLIEWRLSAQSLRPEEEALLKAINPYGTTDEPRSVKMLNALAQSEGVATRFEYTPKAQNAPASPSVQ